MKNHSDTRQADGERVAYKLLVLVVAAIVTVVSFVSYLLLSFPFLWLVSLVGFVVCCRVLSCLRKGERRAAAYSMAARRERRVTAGEDERSLWQAAVKIRKPTASCRGTKTRMARFGGDV